MQCGFRPEQSVENALLRYEAAIRCGNTAATLLDLKWAYGSVPRGLLIKALKKCLNPTLAAILGQFLENDLVRTVGDETGESYPLTRGVPQGSPSSTSMFNIFIDSLVDRLAAVLTAISRHPANVLVDDFLFIYFTRDALQILLEICSSSVTAKNMYWSPSKCVALLREQNAALWLLQESNYARWQRRTTER